jgi:hypothetical protein
MPDNKAAVIKSYPQAVARCILATKPRGETRDRSGGTWLILQAEGVQNQQLGTGETEPSAWADAAETITKGLK